MPIRHASAFWEGSLVEGKGRVRTESNAVDTNYSYAKRFGDEKGTNPEELIGAAHAGCFSMAFANILSGKGFVPDSIKTAADVNFQKVGDGFKITDITLKCEGNVPKITPNDFLELAELAKKNCPVSQALTGVNIKLEAKLLA
jgi:lipoyl-dependent peroxiredoxin